MIGATSSPPPERGRTASEASQVRVCLPSPHRTPTAILAVLGSVLPLCRVREKTYALAFLRLKWP
jgi:hypothetical protein